MTASPGLEHHFERFASRVSEARDAPIGAERLDEDQIEALEANFGADP